MRNWRPNWGKSSTRARRSSRWATICGKSAIRWTAWARWCRRSRTARFWRAVSAARSIRIAPRRGRRCCGFSWAGHGGPIWRKCPTPSSCRWSWGTAAALADRGRAGVLRHCPLAADDAPVSRRPPAAGCPDRGPLGLIARSEDGGQRLSRGRPAGLHSRWGVGGGADPGVEISAPPCNVLPPCVIMAIRVLGAGPKAVHRDLGRASHADATGLYRLRNSCHLRPLRAGNRVRAEAIDEEQRRFLHVRPVHPRLDHGLGVHVGQPGGAGVGGHGGQRRQIRRRHEPLLLGRRDSRHGLPGRLHDAVLLRLQGPQRARVSEAAV